MYPTINTLHAHEIVAERRRAAEQARRARTIRGGRTTSAPTARAGGIRIRLSSALAGRS